MHICRSKSTSHKFVYQTVVKKKPQFFNTKLFEKNQSRNIIFTHSDLFESKMTSDLQANTTILVIIELGEMNVSFSNNQLDFHKTNPSLGQVYEELPYDELVKVVAGLGHVHVEHDNDGIVRSVYLKQGVGNAHWDHVAVTALNLSRENELGELPGKQLESKGGQKFSIVKNFHNFILRIFSIL